MAAATSNTHVHAPPGFDERKQVVLDPEKQATVDPEKQTAYHPSEDNGDVGKVQLKHADRNDADEALKIFADGEVIVLTPADEKRLLRKIDLNLIPLMCVVYGLNYLDKTTLSYASIMGLKVCRLHASLSMYG
jgi:MFS transporter, ACS family, allantoate permease